MSAPQKRKRRRPPVHNPPRKNAALASVPEPPPVLADVWKWFRTGLFDAGLFLIAAVVSSIVQLRTGFQWIIVVGALLAIVLTNLRRLPVRPKPIKAGYFGGLSGLFSVSMLGMLLVTPRASWPTVLIFSAVMLGVCITALVIGVRSVKAE